VRQSSAAARRGGAPRKGTTTAVTHGSGVLGGAAAAPATSPSTQCSNADSTVDRKLTIDSTALLSAHGGSHQSATPSAPSPSLSQSFPIFPFQFFAPLTASSIPVPLAIEEVARRPCLMPAADLVVRAAAAAAAVLALSSDREMQPLECSGASRTSERGR